MWQNFLQKIVKFIDPKLERYREKPAEPVKKIVPKYTPRTMEDFVGVIRRTPLSVLSTKERNRIAAVMSYDSRTVGELMVQKDRMIFVKDKEMLGPLVLDKLYKSGFTNFPVVDAKGKVKGIINTEALNALEVREMEKAEKYLDAEVYYLHTYDTLRFATDEIERTGKHYFLVMDKEEKLAGFFTVQILLEYLVG